MPPTTDSSPTVMEWLPKIEYRKLTANLDRLLMTIPPFSPVITLYCVHNIVIQDHNKHLSSGSEEPSVSRDNLAVHDAETETEPEVTDPSDADLTWQKYLMMKILERK